MLTLVESISLAGDRAKQNDDAAGSAYGRAWVIDGATDLHEAKLTRTASDAAWIAHFANARFHAAQGGVLGEIVREASGEAAEAFARLAGQAPEKWMSPIASLLMIEETAHGVSGLDLGDCRLFALSGDGAAVITGGPPDAVDDETALAAKQTDADLPLLQRTSTIAVLRTMRAGLNREGAQWTFGLDPDCAAHARTWSFKLTPPAHLLLMTDGFSALSDRYRAYTGPALVEAAVQRGLQELGRELRTIETADAGPKFPRFKKSDDATALLLRWS